MPDNRKLNRVGRPVQALVMPVIKGANDELAVNDLVMVRTRFSDKEDSKLATILEIRKRDNTKTYDSTEIEKGECDMKFSEDVQQKPVKQELVKSEREDVPIGTQLDSLTVKNELAEENQQVADQEAMETLEQGYSRMELDNDKSGAADAQEPTTEEQASTSEESLIYYVHYKDMDRRLDEWVDRSRILDTADIADKHTPLPTPADVTAGGLLTRSQKRLHEEFRHMPKAYEDMDATTAKLEKQHEEWTKVKNIEVIQFGRHEVDAWYFSPYPSQFTASKRLYICEFCLNYMQDLERYQIHMAYMCQRRQPPGDEIYRSGNLSVYEVDGKINKVDDNGAHMVGHFSKERMSENNLACIMVLPPFQRRGYGKLLIQLSYCLSKREQHIGTPEKPLSDLGKVSYRSYWWWVLLGVLDERRVDQDISVMELSRISNIHVEDIISTFNTMQLIKYWKGDHVVRANRKIVQWCINKANLYKAPRLLLDKSAVRWSPKYKWNSR
ncbi:histone acetyltransferase MYST1 [Aphelenchoides avenae]|nr:histone acetyltransferase MYST1 [Aphelenchus avenae]